MVAASCAEEIGMRKLARRGRSPSGVPSRLGFPPPVWDWDETKLERAQGIENVRTNKKHETVWKKVGAAEFDTIASHVTTLLEAR